MLWWYVLPIFIFPTSQLLHPASAFNTEWLRSFKILEEVREAVGKHVDQHPADYTELLSSAKSDDGSPARKGLSWTSPAFVPGQTLYAAPDPGVVGPAAVAQMLQALPRAARVGHRVPRLLLVFRDPHGAPVETLLRMQQASHCSFLRSIRTCTKHMRTLYENMHTLTCIYMSVVFRKFRVKPIILSDAAVCYHC